MNTATETRFSDLSPPPHASAPTDHRYDIYGTIHRALRLCMMESLAHVGSLDVENAEEMRLQLSKVESLLGLMRSHLAKENKFVHTALEARQPGASQRIAQEHVQHEQTIDALSDAVADLWASTAAQRGALAQRLYHHLALVVADNFEHMHYEETVHNTALWNSYTDAELQALEQQIKASLAPKEMMLWLHWIARSTTPEQLLSVMMDMQANAPKEAFESALELVHQQLSPGRWSMLAQALNVPQVAGLVDFRRN